MILRFTVFVQNTRTENRNAPAWLNAGNNPRKKVTQNDKPSRSIVTFWPLLLALLAIILRLALPASWLEYGYGQGLFVALRVVWDAVIGWVPVPLFYLFWLGVIVWTISFVRQIWRGPRLSKGRVRRSKGSGKAAAVRLVNALGILVAAFLLGWGFNYGRPEVADYAGFAYYEPTLAELRDRVRTEAAELSRLRAYHSQDTAALPATLFTTPDIGHAVRSTMVAALTELGYPAPGKPAIRQLYPKGVLLTWSTAGVYWPWAGQGNIDAGLHYLQKPAIAAHEMAHGYGFGDEGTCTFIAWLSGTKYPDDHIYAYAFRLSYWRRLAGKLRQSEPEAYWAWRADSLDPGIRNDLQAIYDNRARYTPVAPVIRDVTYDAYLKAQGIHEGLLNYGKVMRMVEGYLLKFEGGDR